MIDRTVAKAIANVAVFLEFSDSSAVDPDSATQAMEQLAADLQLLADDERRNLCRQFEIIAGEYADKQAAFVSNLSETLGVSV